MDEASDRAPVTALDWYATMPPPALALHDNEGHLHVRRYTGTSAEMRQPPLRDNLLCMHLGGAKTVRRWHDGHASVHDADLGSLTIMPANQVNRWQTEGPIDFAHITLSQAVLDQVAIEEFDIEPTGRHLRDSVGIRDPHLEQLFRDLLMAIENRNVVGRLYPDSLLIVLTTHLLKGHAAAPLPRGRQGLNMAPKGGLASWRLRRVVDFMQANLAKDIGLLELTALTGLSRAQFFRAFRQSTGVSPHRYLQALRLDHARELFKSTDMSVSDVATTVGIPNGARFTAKFRSRFGVSPRLFRLFEDGVDAVDSDRFVVDGTD